MLVSLTAAMTHNDVIPRFINVKEVNNFNCVICHIGRTLFSVLI